MKQWFLSTVANFRAAVGRPRAIEGEQTVMVGNQILSWPGPFKKTANANGTYELYSPDDLLLKRGYKVYREMLADDTVKACLSFKKLLVYGRAWEVVPADGKDAEEKQKTQADFCQDRLQAMAMNRIMRETLTALDFGFSVGEVIWEVADTDDGLKVVPKDVKHRDPEFIKIEVDIHGNILQYKQMSGLPTQDIYLKPEKVMHLSHGSSFGNHYGISDLRACYRAWWSKKFITQFWNVFLERFGSPLMMMKYPSGASSELKSALQNILSSLSSRSDILVPEGVIVELIEATRAGTAQYGEALNYCDVGISRAILVPALLGMGVDVKRGSDSQSRLHLRVLMKVAGDIAIDLERVINCCLIKPMIDMNFGPQKDYPKFIFRDYGEYEAVEIVDSAINMFNAGMLDCDQYDINYLRSTLGLPLREDGDEDEIKRPEPAPLGNPNNPNDSGAGAGKNNARAKKGASAPSNRAKD